MTRHGAGAGAGRGRIAWHTPTLVAAATAQGGVALWLGAQGWFSGDLIHYYVERGGASGGGEGLMEPHSAHLQVTLIVGYLVMFKLLGLTTYVPYLAVTVLVHLALVVAMHRLLVRLGTDPLAALVAALALLTYGAGSEAFIVEAPVALSAAMLVAVVATLVVLRGDFDRRSCLTASALLLLGVTISLGGVVAAVWVGFLALSRGVRAMAAVVLLPALMFVVWYAVWGHDASRVQLSGAEVMRIPESAWALVVAPVDDLTGGWGAGPALVVAMVAVTVWSARTRPMLVSVVLAGFAAATFHAVLSAVAQLPYGLEQVLTSRYRYVVLVGMLPGLALLLDVALATARGRLTVAHLRVVHPLAAGLGCMLLLHAALGQYRVGEAVETVGDKTRSLLAGTAMAMATGEEPINDSVQGSYISGRDLARLADPSLASELPRLRQTAEDRIDAEGSYFVEVSQAELELGSPGVVRSDSFDDTLEPGSGCRVYTATNATPTLTITSLVGAGFRVRSEASSVTTRLHRPDEGVEGELVAWKVEPGEWTHIGTTAQVAELDVTFDTDGRFTICPY